MAVLLLIFLAGLAVYAGYGISGLLFLLAAVLTSYAAGLLIPRFRWITPLAVTLCALTLLTVRLQPVTGMAFTAPLGISYFTLQIIAYLVDVHRGTYPPQRNLLRYGLYVSYLPHIFLGPIERHDRFLSALQARRVSWDGISAGGLRILWGLFKKLVIAARAGVIIASVSADPSRFRGSFALAAMILYSVQLYADFSGGMDMALGASRMLGIRLSENFDVPYAAQTIPEFWRRWHITLGSWLRDYVYIPLGGSRKGRLRKVLNTVVTFLVSGIWHGIHYLLWGLLHGIFVSLGNALKTPWKRVNQVLTFLIVSVLWSFFIWPDTLTALEMIGSLFTGFQWPALLEALPNLGLNTAEWAVLALAVLILWFADLRMERIKAGYLTLSPAGRLACIGALALTVLVFGMYGIGFDVEAFIYSSF